MSQRRATPSTRPAATYGWPEDLPEEKVLRRLLALNLEREPA